MDIQNRTVVNIDPNNYLESNNFFIDAEVLDSSEHQVLNNEVDSDIFKYFLNDELQTKANGFVLDSPESDGSEATPPQLTPESSVDDFLSSTPTPSSPKISRVKEESQSRKRSAPTTSEKAGSSKEVPVALSRDELVMLSAKGIETYNTTQGKVGSDEERQLKRQRRLIKNRESAQLSRLRKKVYIEELERKVNQLNAENENLTKQVNAIAADKKKLQEEVIHLHGIIKQNPSFASQLANSKKLPQQQRNVKAAGLVLLVVLFSFGLLFNSNPGLVASENNDQVAPRPKNFYAGRVLKSVKDEGNVSAVMPSEPPKAVASASSIKPSEKKETSVVNSNALKGVSTTPQTVSKMEFESSGDSINPKKRKMKIADEDPSTYHDRDGRDVADAKNALVTRETPALSNDTLSLTSSGNAPEVIVRPNTDYIYCRDAQRISPSPSQNRPENIALLIPSSLLDASLDPGFDASLLEDYPAAERFVVVDLATLGSMDFVYED